MEAGFQNPRRAAVRYGPLEERLTDAHDGSASDLTDSRLLVEYASCRERPRHAAHAYQPEVRANSYDDEPGAVREGGVQSERNVSFRPSDDCHAATRVP